MQAETEKMWKGISQEYLRFEIKEMKTSPKCTNRKNNISNKPCVFVTDKLNTPKNGNHVDHVVL